MILSSTQRAVLRFLMQKAPLSATYAELAFMTNSSRKSVERAVKRLKKAGALNITRMRYGRGAAYTYEITPRAYDLLLADSL